MNATQLCGRIGSGMVALGGAGMGGIALGLCALTIGPAALPVIGAAMCIIGAIIAREERKIQEAPAWSVVAIGTVPVMVLFAIVGWSVVLFLGVVVGSLLLAGLGALLTSFTGRCKPEPLPSWQLASDARSSSPR